MPPTEHELIRLDFTGADVTQAVTVDDATGDVLFDCIAVDKTRKPNRLRFVFDWDRPADVDTKALQANPVLLYRHDDFLPCGRIEEIEVDDRRVRMRCRIPNYSQSAVPAEQELDKWLGVLRAYVRDKYIRAVSIGFYRGRYEVEQAKDAQGKPAEVLRLKTLEIIELSLCAIGAHQTALIQFAPSAEQARAALAPHGALWTGDPATDRVLVRMSLPEASGVAKAGAGHDSPAQALRNGLQRVSGGLVASGEAGATSQTAAAAGAEAQAPGWRAIPYSRHGDIGPADEGEDWDGPGEVKVADTEDLAVMCTLENPEELDNKAGYKLPHHKARGHAPVWRGVAAAMGVLLGARGGVKGVSDDAKKKAHGHLAKHYQQFDKEAPEYQALSEEALASLHESGRVIVPGRAPNAQSAPAPAAPASAAPLPAPGATAPREIVVSMAEADLRRVVQEALSTPEAKEARALLVDLRIAEMRAQKGISRNA